jgi:hypothetical protein
VAVTLVGVLMVIYVTFGGMMATTWVQIIKAVLLIAGGTVVAFLAFAQFGFSFGQSTKWRPMSRRGTCPSSTPVRLDSISSGWSGATTRSIESTRSGSLAPTFRWN